ncbi:hypothetical protein, partial [Streptomyces sp. NPDC003996]
MSVSGLGVGTLPVCWAGAVLAPGLHMVSTPVCQVGVAPVSGLGVGTLPVCWAGAVLAPGLHMVSTPVCQVGV